MPNTLFSENLEEIKNVLKEHKKVIIKPVNSFSGYDIHLLFKFNIKLI